MFSQTVEYSLRAVAHLAMKAPELVCVREMAEAIRLPEAYLAKVLQKLSEANIVVTRRGKGGGATLVRRPIDLTLLEVVQAVDPINRILTCPMGLPSHGKLLCPLHSRIDKALEALEEAFGNTTIHQILNDATSPSKPLCEVGRQSMISLGLGRTNDAKHPLP